MLRKVTVPAFATDFPSEKAGNRLWARIDREIVDHAPRLPRLNLNTVDFLGAHRQLQFQPQWGVLDQLWVP